MSRIWMLVSILAVMSLAAQAAPRHMIYVNGHAMISLRAFTHHIGAVVGYDLGRGAITVTRDVRTVYLTPYSTTAWINDQPTAIRHPVLIIDDVTYVPLRFMCHAFELDCTWSADRTKAFILVNVETNERLEFDRDDTWSQRPHITQHEFDYHTYQKFQEQHPAHMKPTAATAYQHGNHATPIQINVNIGNGGSGHGQRPTGYSKPNQPTSNTPHATGYTPHGTTHQSGNSFVNTITHPGGNPGQPVQTHGGNPGQSAQTHGGNSGQPAQTHQGGQPAESHQGGQPQGKDQGKGNDKSSNDKRTDHSDR